VKESLQVQSAALRRSSWCRTFEHSLSETWLHQRTFHHSCEDSSVDRALAYTGRNVVCIPLLDLSTDQRASLATVEPANSKLPMEPARMPVALLYSVIAKDLLFILNSYFLMFIRKYSWMC
jgi:hypothetical protein